MNRAKETDMQLAHIKFAAIYARVPTEDQGNGCLIPTRLEACRELAR